MVDAKSPYTLGCNNCNAIVFRTPIFRLRGKTNPAPSMFCEVGETQRNEWIPTWIQFEHADKPGLRLNLVTLEL